MKRYLIVLALALVPVCGYAGIDGHRFALGLSGQAPTNRYEMRGAGIEGVYEMYMNKVMLGAGVGFDCSFTRCDFHWMFPMFLRAGYFFTDNLAGALNAGYKLNPVNGNKLSCVGCGHGPWKYNSFFIEPQVAYQLDMGLRFSLGVELYNNGSKSRPLDKNDPSGAISSYNGFCTSISLGVSYVFGGR